MTGSNEKTTLNFLPVGHTKFTPDACFGLIKQKYRRTRVDCLKDILDVVEGSSRVQTGRKWVR
jgi:hypothetical protein